MKRQGSEGDPHSTESCFSRLPGVSMPALGELASFFGIAVALVEPGGTGVHLNAQWQAWRSSYSTMGPCEWLEAFEPNDRPLVNAALTGARQNGGASMECQFMKADGTILWVHLRIFAMRDTAGAIEGFVLGASDITRLHHVRTRLEQTALSMIASLSRMEAMRDLYTSDHQERVGQLAESIGAALGMAGPGLAGLRIAAMLHDIGKIATPIGILTKPARLTAGEFALIKEHAENGYAILREVAADWPVARVAHEHHERLDGSGYPQGLRGDDILLEARITAVADVVESMAVHRPYRRGFGVDAALEEIQKNKGRLYDPDAVDACIRIVEDGFALHPGAL